MSIDVNRVYSSSVNVGDDAEALWPRDSTSYKACKVLDQRHNGVHRQLYVHFIDLDKRLDEWTAESNVRFLQTKPEETSTENRQQNKTTNISTLIDERRRTRSSLTPMNPHKMVELVDNTEAKDFDTTVSKPVSGGNVGVAVVTQTKWDKFEKEHEELTRIRNVHSIYIGKYHINSWYFSPFPDEYGKCEKLYICEFCLKYMRKAKTLLSHQCRLRHPPGNEIYRKDNISVFEIDGKNQKLYCQNLCLLAKLFLDHKTLYYDVSPFFFYILVENDDDGCHLVGFFSKEKESAENFNVACILVFPQHQRKGFGKFLVQLSYALTKLENKVGSPEKPLSDLGKVTYRSYWTFVLLNLLCENVVMTIEELSRRSAFKVDDIVSTLKALDMVRYYKGDHVVHTTMKRVLLQLDKVSAGFSALRFCEKALDWNPPPKKRR